MHNMETAGLIYMPMKQLCPTLFQTTTIGKNNGDKQGEGSYKGKWLLPPDDIGDTSPLAGIIWYQWDNITSVTNFLILILNTNQFLWLTVICILN